MRGHPGGESHTRHMLDLAALPPGARVLDLGAGAGETLTLLRELGYMAEGVDREPRSELVREGDLLHSPYPDGAYDAVISQCAFFVSGNVPGALQEAARLLMPGGLLLLSDVFFEPPRPLLEAAGFRVKGMEDMTEMWRAYYFEALWQGESFCCAPPGAACRYWLLIGEKER